MAHGDHTQEVSVETAAEQVSKLAEGPLKKVSNAYQRGMELFDAAANSKTLNSPLGRMTGMTYLVGSLHMIAGAFRKVDDDTVAEKMRKKEVDPKTGKEKGGLKEAVSYVQETFSYDSLVSAGIYLGKGALVKLAFVKSIAALIPAAAATMGSYVAPSIKGSLEHYFATHEGHHAKEKLGSKVKEGIDFFKGTRRTMKGQDPESAQVHGIVQDFGHQMDKLEHGTEHDANHDHGHDHHHSVGGLKSFAKNYWNDVKSVTRFFTNPIKYGKVILNDMRDDLANIGNALNSETSNQKQMREFMAQNKADLVEKPEINVPQSKFDLLASKI